MWVAVFLTIILRPLTDTKSEVKDAKPNVEPEEENDVGHFAEQEQVAYVLLQCDWKKKKQQMKQTNNLQPVDTWSQKGRITISCLHNRAKILGEHHLYVVCFSPGQEFEMVAH